MVVADEPELYWPDGVKLDSKVVLDRNGQAIQHEVSWVLRWDNLNPFFFTDYYAHDLYMDLTEGTFLELESISIRATEMPRVGIYREDSIDQGRLRIGWATYRPSEIEPNVTYTVTLFSATTDASIDPFAEDFETYGIRFPPTCVARCAWFPTSWCSIAEGGDTLVLRNNPFPDGIHPLGVPLGGCARPLFLFVPIVLTP